ncbi:acetyltransferase [Novosphingobium lentum]|uniref:acetyltransferase n=1 Tax=Novosphingobium lentum TaxID=145287 RepID=UPI00082BC4FA|nr:acetyltransferase [Novosphingobium lentum]
MTLLDAQATRPLEGGASFSLRNRMLRVVWMATWLVLARFTPPPLHRWRRRILRLFGARIAPGARVHASVMIWLPANLTLGEHALIGPGVRIYNQGHIAIGARTVISQRAHICASTHDVRDPAFQLVLRPVTIGERCWVAAEAFVGPGVMMADRAVLGARAALFTDVPEDAVFSGNPAVFVKQRGLRAE